MLQHTTNSLLRRLRKQSKCKPFKNITPNIVNVVTSYTMSNICFIRVILTDESLHVKPIVWLIDWLIYWTYECSFLCWTSIFLLVNQRSCTTVSWQCASSTSCGKTFQAWSLENFSLQQFGNHEHRAVHKVGLCHAIFDQFLPPLNTGVDLSKILGRQTKILGEKVVKSDKCMDVSQLLGPVPGHPPKSTPMPLSIGTLCYKSRILKVRHTFDIKSPNDCLASLW